MSTPSAPPNPTRFAFHSTPLLPAITPQPPGNHLQPRRTGFQQHGTQWFHHEGPLTSCQQTLSQLFSPGRLQDRSILIMAVFACSEPRRLESGETRCLEQRTHLLSAPSLSRSLNGSVVGGRALLMGTGTLVFPGQRMALSRRPRNILSRLMIS